MEDKVKTALRSIGLNKAEVDTYLDLVSYGPSTVLSVSKRTSLYRSNTYDSIRKLIEKGFVKENLEDGKRLFKALEPERIREYMRQKEKDMLDVLPKLTELAHKDFQEEKATIAHGSFSLREALTDLLSMREDIHVLTQSTNVEVFGEGFIKEFHKERARKKILLKMIYFQKNPRIKVLNKKPFTKVKYISCPEDYPATKITCGDKIYLFSHTKPLTAIQIISKEMADSNRGIFDVLWNTAAK